MEQGWDEELEKRQEALKCRICNGTNPYICRCAREAWVSENKGWLQWRHRHIMTVQEKRDWMKFKSLYPGSMEECDICNNGEYICYCEFAKKTWLEWYNQSKKLHSK
jgi:hypothetical protein